MPTPVLVPPLGQTVDTLTLAQWLKQEGDAVRQGEPLYVVETDKASLEIEAPASGILRQVTAKPGDEVAVLSAIAMIAAPDEEVETTADHRPQMAARDALLATPNSPPRTPHPPPSTRLFVSPRARRLAELEGVPLAELTATGPEGAIVERDVQAYVVRGAAERERAAVEAERAADRAITPVAKKVAEEAGLAWQSVTGTGPGGRVTREDVEQALAGRSVAEPAPTPSPIPSSAVVPASPHLPPDETPDLLETIPMRSVRAVIANRMQQSHSQTAPVTLTAEADATALVVLRAQLAVDGVAASYNDFLLRILARALVEHPRMNASLQGSHGNADEIKLWRNIDIGLAVDTDRGLLVPVVSGVDRKGLAELAKETKALAERARSGQCTPAELTGGTFTLTNLGMYGIDAFTPIINLPECAILGVGRIQRRPVMAGEAVVGRDLVWLSLTFDHRLVDGGQAARFLQRVVQLVEKPHLLMA